MLLSASDQDSRVALGALPALELFGIEPPVSIALSTAGIQLWFLALAALFLWRVLRRQA